MSFKKLLLLLSFALQLQADFYDEIEKADTNRKKQYSEINGTIKIPDISPYNDMIQEAMQGLQERMDEHEITVYGANKKEILKNLGKDNKEAELNFDRFLQKNRIYIFMSSSVPKKIWYEYGAFIDKHKLRNNYMLLRGCIGGCEKIKPTINFVTEILRYNKSKTINPQILLDPILFKRYGVDEAPCFVYVKNIEVINQGYAGSEGDENQIKTGRAWKSCGDWEFMHHLNELERQSRDKELSRLIKKIVENEI